MKRTLEGLFYVFVVFCWTYFIHEAFFKVLGPGTWNDLVSLVCGITTGILVVWGLMALSIHMRVQYKKNNQQ